MFSSDMDLPDGHVAQSLLAAEKPGDEWALKCQHRQPPMVSRGPPFTIANGYTVLTLSLDSSLQLLSFYYFYYYIDSKKESRLSWNTYMAYAELGYFGKANFYL